MKQAILKRSASHKMYYTAEFGGKLSSFVEQFLELRLQRISFMFAAVLC